MRKDIAKYFFQFLNINTDYVPVYTEVPDIIPENDLKPLLDEIFSVDPRTGMPRGDIAYFLSKDGNPQVKAFIEQALFAEVRQAPSADPEKISDDMLYEFSRKDGESVADYSARLDGYRKQAIDFLEKSRETRTE